MEIFQGFVQSIRLRAVGTEILIRGSFKSNRITVDNRLSHHWLSDTRGDTLLDETLSDGIQYLQSGLRLVGTNGNDPVGTMKRRNLIKGVMASKG